MVLLIAAGNQRVLFLWPEEVMLLLPLMVLVSEWDLYRYNILGVLRTKLKLLIQLYILV